MYSLGTWILCWRQVQERSFLLGRSHSEGGERQKYFEKLKEKPNTINKK